MVSSALFLLWTGCAPEVETSAQEPAPKGPYPDCLRTWFPDADLDGWGDVAGAVERCEKPSGYLRRAGDCDDTTATTNPRAQEVCDGADNNCNGHIDENWSAIDVQTFWIDRDGDGYGDLDYEIVSCDQPPPAVPHTGAGAATDTPVNAGAPAVCNGLDADCDGDVDNLDSDIDSCVDIDVSNVDVTLMAEADAGATLTGDATLDTDTGEITGIRSAGTGSVDGIWFDVETQDGGGSAGVFVVAGLTVPSGTTLTVQGSNPLVILSTEDVDISGTLAASGGDGVDAYTTSGNSTGGNGTTGSGDGGTGSDNNYTGATDGVGDAPGTVANPGIHYGNGGGGGGMCYGGGGGMGDRPSVAGSAGTSTAGGAGGYGGGDGGWGGDGGGISGDGSLTPLHAGSGGAGGVSDTDNNPSGAGGGGGAGGGAVQLSVDATLSVTGTVTVSGGRGGDAYGGGGGGGSGGGLLIEGATVDVSGSLLAEGGRGGHGNLSWSPSGTTGGSAGMTGSPGGGGGATESGGGGGGAGWIRVRIRDGGTFSGYVSPGTTYGCTTQETM